MTISPKSLLAAGILATLGLATLPQTAASQTLACDQDYTVRSGDSLTGLAARAYGDSASYQFIYNANSARIGANPGIIRLGEVIFIPCIRSTIASTAEQLTPDPTPERLPVRVDEEIRIVTATDWAPFLNEDQEQGGMLAELVNVAMSNADNQTDYKIDFVNDWGAHLTPLITDMAYDFSIAWFKPNCDALELLADDSQFRCNNFSWTDPIFEQIFGYYNRSSDPALKSYSDMIGKTICRPDGYATFMLEENDLKAPNIVLERPVAVADCFNGLHDGKYDIVAIATDTADNAIADLGISARTRHNNDLSQVLTLHGVISVNHPQSDFMLAEFNSGLAKIKSSGEWFQIVLRHLQEHKAKTN